ncbi:Aldo/keto reductase [Dichomitus squalens]|uniref:Aldo/keto reductase n=2 Tax=Dichomitus squalens TaxID=114155 RepID=A0A4Q9QB57_9APHY|nr:Aldo/keto reductase [Dichomitus squalens LYAD-421 SS1]EJF55834.1 Aldo/keto reductase [Dichomitus squalens LYAD-421 SS1]TBU48095.1 Aldo/keto reductase [Dichomitus squalens]TBU64376.1 Aldo/keto reductase [Dichomitus squalens]
MATAKIIYGTAWKKERTTALVVSAVLHGFRAIDTACQPKHYREDLVGAALQILYDQHGIKREELFLQTKFTSIDGQDQNQPLPYDPSADIPTQIQSSLRTSLKNLRTTYLDSLVLHSPLRTLSQTLAAWRTLVSLQASGVVRKIGVSNTYDVAVLESLERDGGRRPDVVQNRWFEGNRWDSDVWAYCVEHGIQYQSFWTLSGSPSLLRHPTVRSISSAKGCTPAQALFKIAQLNGITPLCGTTNEQHMDEALAVERLDLSDVQASVDDVLKFIRA